MEMNNKTLSFPVQYEKISEINNEDGRFTKVKINILHLGSNFNGSVFEKDIVDEAIPSLAYIPIVGFMEKDKITDENDFSDHRYIFTKTKDGVVERYAGHGYGVILSSNDNNAHYEDMICSDGETRTFLCVEGVLWNMFEDMVDIFNRDVNKNQSMELYVAPDSYDGYEDENGLFHFTKFSFRASCILGNDVEPAMIDSEIKTQFSLTDFSRQLQDEFLDKYTSFTKVLNENNNKGDIDMTDVNTDFAQTVLEQFNDISTMVSDYATRKDYWGDDVPRYYVADIQENVVIAVDCAEHYNYVGFPFVVNGDKPEIDFASGKRYKIQYSEYEDGFDNNELNVFNFDNHIIEIENTASDKISELQANYENANEKISELETKVSEYEKQIEDIKTDYSSLEEINTELQSNYDDMKNEYQKLVDAENERKAIELSAQKDAEIEKYSVALNGNAEYEKICENKADMTIEDIENQCALIFAKVNLNTNFSLSSGTNKGITGLVDDDFGIDKNYSTRYGRIISK